VNKGLWSVIERADGLSPAAGRRMAGLFLRLASPFNAPLRASVEVWEPTRCRVRVPNRRALHNHLGGVHAGALVTAGETPAGLLVLKSFPFSRYRLILKDLAVTYQRQARTDLLAEARLESSAIQKAQAGLDAGEAQLLAVETTLSEPGGEPLALVKTTWQVKPWSSVRGRS
jgi:acyl-coenzyme A thioesterase PaaI-like protein